MGQGEAGEITPTRADLLDADRLIARRLAGILQPRDPVPLSKWLAENIVLVDGPLKGEPWEPAGAPYLAEIADCLGDDNPSTLVTVRKSQQTGASILALGWALYVADREPANFLFAVPGIDALHKMNGQKLQPLIEAWEKRTRRTVIVPQTSRSGAGSSTYEKRFAGGSIVLANANSVMDLSSATVKKGVKDEVSKWTDIPGYGDPENLFFGRFTAFRRTRSYKILEISTPEVDSGVDPDTTEATGHCRIDRSFRRSDQRFWHVPCPQCGEAVRLTFEMMEVDRAAPDKSFLRMTCCGYPMSEPERVVAVKRGRWVASTPGPDRHPGFHIDAFVSLMMSIEDIARDFLAISNEGERKLFWNLVLGLPYKFVEAQVDHEKIAAAAQRAPYPRGQVPAWAGVVVSAADVQGYGIKWLVYAVGPNGHRALIDKEVFEGDPAQSDEPWRKLADALGRTYATAGGVPKKIDLSAIDSGFNTYRVYEFVAGRPNLYAVDGRAKGRVHGSWWLGSPKKVEAKSKSGQKVAKALLYPVFAHDIKSEIMAGLANLAAGPGEDGRWPHNVVFLTPELADTSFIQELTAERLVKPSDAVTRMSRGKRRRYAPANDAPTWLPVFGRPNDWLDATVYALAVAWSLKVDRWSKEKWNALLAEVHGVPPAGDLFEQVEPSPFGPPAPRETKPARRFGAIRKQ